MRKRKVLIWTTLISDLLDEGKTTGGIAVQLYFWALTFKQNGWLVTSLCERHSYRHDGIFFFKKNNWGKLEILHEWFAIFWILLTSRPTLVISRGSDRSNYPLAILTKVLRIKYIFFAASDVNFVPGKDSVAGGHHNTNLYRKSIKFIPYIVVQNNYQQQTLKKNYRKDSLIIPNIWSDIPSTGNIEKESSDVVWVANFRKLKRPEWIISTAKQLTDIQFSMIGGPTNNIDYYNKIKNIAEKQKNITFWGVLSFITTTEKIRFSKILACTSEFEGFPNTFLQAWANDIPVISTVDPSNVITTYNLGIVIETEDDLQKQIRNLLQNNQLYEKMKQNIHTYFATNHAADTNLSKLMKYVNLPH